MQQVYSQDVLRYANADIDCDRVHRSLTNTEIGDRYIVAREVYVGNDFVSFGRVLVSKDYWRSFAGIWVADDSSLFAQEEYRIEALPEGGLACTATGVQAQQAEKVKTAFQGKGHRLFGEEQHDSELVFGVHEGDSRKGSLVWQSSAGGQAEVLTRTSTGISNWAPAEVRFNGFEQLSVFHDGVKVGTFVRQVPKDLDCRTFDGSDWVFGDEIHWSEVLTTPGSSLAALHFAQVDEESCVLRVLMSEGRGGRGRPSSLVIPIPATKIAETKEYVEKWQSYKTPLFWRGRAYYGSAASRLAHNNPLLDHSLRIYCAVMLASSFAAMATMTATMEGQAAADASGGDGGGLFEGGLFGF